MFVMKNIIGLTILLMLFGFVWTGTLFAREEGPIDIDDMPELIKEQVPVYPEAARKAGIKGVVWVKAFIDNIGNVTSVEVFKTSDYDVFDNSALEAARQNKFKPAIKDNKPVATFVIYRVEFVISDKK